MGVLCFGVNVSREQEDLEIPNHKRLYKRVCLKVKYYF